MSDYAQIVGHHYAVPGTPGYDVYEWRGPRYLPVMIDGGLVDMIDGGLEEIIKLLPWPLRVLDYDPSWDRYICIRTDTYTWLWTGVKNKARNAFGRINIRLLATAKVWGLLDWPDFIYPSWRNLKLFKKRK